MIFIDRNRRSDEGRTIRPSDEWFRLAQHAEDQAIEESNDHKTRDDIYGHDSARAALHELFHRKCAYCEVAIPNRTGWNVDHFRPKGRVVERKDHTGYYWLAYRWSNLYPACEDCNKRLYDTPTFDDPTLGPPAGKFDQFPLADEATRAMSPRDDVTRENYLLLDPCADRPEDHLYYDVEGEILSPQGDDRAEATLRVLNLARKRLRDNRRKTVAEVVEMMRELRVLEAEKDRKLESLRDILERRYFGDSCEHAAVARFIRRDPDAFGL